LTYTILALGRLASSALNRASFSSSPRPHSPHPALMPPPHPGLPKVSPPPGRSPGTTDTLPRPMLDESEVAQRPNVRMAHHTNKCQCCLRMQNPKHLEGVRWNHPYMQLTSRKMFSDKSRWKSYSRVTKWLSSTRWSIRFSGILSAVSKQTEAVATFTDR